MKQLTFMTLLLLACLLSAAQHAIAAQEVKYSLNKGWNNDMKIYDDTLFVATENGVFAYALNKEDATWKLYAFDNLDITKFVKSGQKILAVQRIVTYTGNIRHEEQRLLLSADYGKSYANITRHSFEGDYSEDMGYAINIHQLPDASNHVIVVYPSKQYFNTYISKGIVEESIDFGQQWSQKEIPFPPTGKVAFRSENANSMLIYGLIPNVDCTCPYLLECKDDFQTITNIPFDVYEHNMAFREIVYNPSDDGRLLAATNGGIAKSTDNAITWELVVEAYSWMGFMSVQHDIFNPNIVYAFLNTYNTDSKKIHVEIYLSKDAGDSWSKVYNSGPHGRVTTKISRHNGKFYFLTDKDEVFSVDVSNLATMITSIKQDPLISSDDAYDLSGRKVTDANNHQPVILNGRKVIVK